MQARVEHQAPPQTQTRQDCAQIKASLRIQLLSTHLGTGLVPRTLNPWRPRSAHHKVSSLADLVWEDVALQVQVAHTVASSAGSHEGASTSGVSVTHATTSSSLSSC